MSKVLTYLKAHQQGCGECFNLVTFIKLIVLGSLLDYTDYYLPPPLFSYKILGYLYYSIYTYHFDLPFSEK